MGIQLSVAARNAQADALETAIGASAKFRIYGGAAMPANTATARAGTQLAEATLPADWWAAASAGAKVLSGTWQDAAADAAGLARYFSIMDSAGTTCHIQGLVSQAWAASTAYVLNQHVHNGGNVYICTTAGTSAGSGGPTGTGTGITDGTAVWSYVGTVDVTVDNVNINAGQQVNITAFTYTRGNA